MTAKGVDSGQSLTRPSSFVSVWPHSAALRTASRSKVRFANWRQNNWVKSALVLTYSGKPGSTRLLIGAKRGRGSRSYQSCVISSVTGRPATSQASRPPRYQ